MSFATAKDFVDHFKEGREEYHMPAVGELDEPITKNDLDGLAVVFLFHGKTFCGRSTQECLGYLEKSPANDLLLVNYATERAYRFHKSISGVPPSTEDWGKERMTDISLWLTGDIGSSPRVTCFSHSPNSLMARAHPVGHTGFPPATNPNSGSVLRPIALLRLSDCSLRGWDDHVFTLPSTTLYLPSC